VIFFGAKGHPWKPQKCMNFRLTQPACPGRILT
jgi:hypothetical protein